ncbi:MAG: UDP-N-acetylmuramoyl-L-alanine--D-glutamate ligase [Acidobacteriota bacterium]
MNTNGSSPSWPPAHWRQVLVYGLGVSGVAAMRLLRAHGVAVIGVDRRSAEALALEEGPDFRLLAGCDPQTLPDSVDAVILSPGVPLDRPLLASARQQGVPVLAEVELAYPLVSGLLVAITGSNGKSTTTALTGAMLRAAGRETEVCGNIGEPLTARVEGTAERAFVVELSSFQLETVERFRPAAAALLNVAPDHLDRYPDLDAYAAAKARIFSRQRRGDLAVLNAEDSYGQRIAADLAGGEGPRLRWFSSRRRVEDGCCLDDDRILEVAPGEEPIELFRRSEVPLAGLHNLENAMASALLARAVGASPEAVRRGLASFRGLPHRMQRIAHQRGVAWYDDSKGTNAAATLKSLEDLPDGAVHLILGGQSKGDDPAVLAPMVARKARRVYLIGEAASQLAVALDGAAPLEPCGTLERAVASAASRVQPGDLVLLSPACASFDQFRSFAHRGERFQQLVAEVVAGTERRVGGPHGEKARL